MGRSKCNSCIRHMAHVEQEQNIQTSTQPWATELIGDIRVLQEEWMTQPLMADACKGSCRLGCLCPWDTTHHGTLPSEHKQVMRATDEYGVTSMQLTSSQVMGQVGRTGMSQGAGGAGCWVLPVACHKPRHGAVQGNSNTANTAPVERCHGDIQEARRGQYGATPGPSWAGQAPPYTHHTPDAATAPSTYHLSGTHEHL
jgi:hypothetical protein